jgi:opacity protein-like surface antigen
MRKLLTACFVILVASVPASAQDKPVDVNIGFGATFPTSGFKDSFDTGWDGTIGVTFNLNEHLGLQGEYIYARMNGPEKTILVSVNPGGIGSAQLIESNQQMHIGSFNLVYKNHPSDRVVGGYVLGGFGIYHRTIQLTSPAVGYTTFCDPYWYVCYPAVVSVDNILGDRSSNDFGIDVGGGVTFGHEAKFYVETRYHYVWGPSITTTGSTLPAAAGTVNCSSGCSSNASYIPLTFGVRW